MNRHIFRQLSLKARVTLFTLAIFVISIWSLSFYASGILKDDMRRLLGEQQFSTVSYVVAQINEELEDRVTTLSKVAGRITPEIMKNREALQALLDDRLILKGPFNAGTVVYSINAEAIAQVPRYRKWIGVECADCKSLLGAIGSAKPTVGLPLFNKNLNSVLFCVTVPIFDANGGVIGAIVGITDLKAANFLDKATQNPYGKSGGYVVVSKQGRIIVTATDKKRTLEPVPPLGKIPLIDRFIDGYEGSGIMVNPKGEEVLASVKGIPAANWLASSVLPTKEAFEPIHAVQKHMLMATVLLTFLAALITWRMLKLQLSRVLDTVKTLADMSKSNIPLQPLPVTGEDEICELINGFNKLLEILSQREEQLKALNEELSSRVELEVSKRMQTEEERRREREALIQSEKLAQLGSMLGAIIHQWKQPLNSIALDAQGIADSYKFNELNEAEIKRVVDSIMAKIAFMAATADDFRDFYKPSKEKKPFSVMEQVESVVKLLGKQLHLSDITVNIEGDRVASVVGFASEFKQVVLNIIINAKDAFEERKIKNATIDIKVAKDGENVLLSICDNAGGIPSELLPDKLFEPFYSTKGEKGTGIGLSLSRSIIEENMLGKIGAKNMGDGACFMLELPTV